MIEQENISQNISIYTSQQFHSLQGKDLLIKSIFENYQQLQDVLNYPEENSNFLIILLNIFFGDKGLTYSIIDKYKFNDFIYQVTQSNKKYYKNVQLTCHKIQQNQDKLQLNLIFQVKGYYQTYNLIKFYESEVKCNIIRQFISQNLFQKIIQKSLLILYYTQQYPNSKKQKEIQNQFFVLFSQFCYKYFVFSQSFLSLNQNQIQSEKNLSEKIISIIKDKETIFEIQQMIEFFVQKQIHYFKLLYKQNVHFYIIDKNKMMVNMQGENQNMNIKLHKILNQINFTKQRLALSHQDFQIFPIYIEGFNIDNMFLAIKENVESQIIYKDDLLCNSIKQQVDNYKIDYLKIDDQQLQFQTIFYMLEKFDLFEQFKLSRKKFTKFLHQTKKLYELSCNPYHNFKHGLTVMNGCFYFLTKQQFLKYFNKIGIFALLFASLMHDVKHPGYNNDFMIKNNSEIALTYNDKSVLENYHVSVAFQTLKNQQYNFVQHMNNNDFKDFRKIVIQSILMTDPSKHFKHVKKLDQLIQDNVSFYQSENLENFMYLCGAVTHACDLHGPIKPIDEEIKWSQLVNEEFKNQLKQEQKNGLPLTQMFVQIDIEDKFISNEIFFRQNMVKPLWSSLNTFLGNQFQEQLQNLEKSIQRQKNRQARLLNNQLNYIQIFCFFKQIFNFMIFLLYNQHSLFQFFLQIFNVFFLCFYDLILLLIFLQNTFIFIFQNKYLVILLFCYLLQIFFFLLLIV